jgi:uncharacterized protein (TIGR00369 family)
MSTDFLMDSYCFACGAENKNGLRLDISESEDGVVSTFTPPTWTQGYKKTVHGGIVSTILDELAVWAAFKKGYKCVTAELNIRIKKAMKVNNEYVARGKVILPKHRLILTESEILNKNNELIASAQVKLIKIE